MTNIKLPSRNGLLLEIIDLWNTIQQKKLIEYLQLQSLKQLLYLFAIISKPCGCQFSFDWKEILGNHRRHDIWYTFFVGWHTETILVQMVVCKMQINFLSHNFSIEHNVFIHEWKWKIKRFCSNCSTWYVENAHFFHNVTSFL